MNNILQAYKCLFSLLLSHNMPNFKYFQKISTIKIVKMNVYFENYIEFLYVKS